MVLGAMLISPAAVDTVADLLEGREFYLPQNGDVYRAILNMHSRGKAVDAITVCDELGRAGSKVDPDRVHELATIVPAASNVRHWAEIVRETWLARGLIVTGQEIARLGWEREGEIEGLFHEADRRMVEIQGFLERKNDSVYTGKQLAEDFLRRLNDPSASKPGVRPPFSFLPELMGGRLHVLAGYQGHGKTAASLQFIRSCCEAGRRAGFMSIEMDKDDVTDRLVSSFGVPYHQIVARRIEPEYQDRMNTALLSISEWDFEVVDDEALDPAAVRRHQRRGRYDLLIVDHLHRILIRDKRHERQELEDAVRRFTNIAREFDIPVLLLAQLSRPDRSGGEAFPRPTTASLKGTGAIEQEAAMVWFVWRKCDQMGNPGSQTEFTIAKNRFGSTGGHELAFIGTQVRFTEDVR